MIRILIFDTNFVKGVNRIIVLTKIRYWQKHGCLIDIFCTKEGQKFYSKELKDVKYITVNFIYNVNGPYSLPWQLIKLTLKSLKKINNVIGIYDIVYSQSSVIDFLIIPWLIRKKDKKIKWFVMVDNIVPSPNKRPGPFIQKLIPFIAFKIGNCLLNSSDGIFVVTDFLKHYYLNLKMKKVIKTSNGYGIDKEIFTGTINLKTPKTNALYCGRIHHAKGIIDMVEVVNLVASSNQNFKIGILGDGDAETKKLFYEKIKKYNLERNFIHLGYKTGKEKGDIYRNSDFFLFLSYDEGCPHAVIEALACNKLVLAYNLPIYNEIFLKYIQTKQMILFEKKDYKNIANFIINKIQIDKFHFYNKLDDYSWDIISKKELDNFKNEIKNNNNIHNNSNP